LSCFITVILCSLQEKKEMKKLLFLFTLVLCFSCAKDAQKVVETTNTNFKVELLFIKDGCKVYRFEDAGHYVYFTDCKGNTQSSFSEYNAGTKTSKNITIQNETIR